MRALRRSSSPVLTSAVIVPGLAASFLMLSTQQAAFADLTSYLAKRSGIDQVWRRHVASLVRPSTTVASFAFASPMPREDTPRLQLASLTTGSVHIDPRRAGRNAGPALGAGMDGGVIYPVPNREAKGDLLLERPQLRLSIGSLRDPSLLAPTEDLSAVARFERDPAATDTEHSPLSLGGVQLASAAPAQMLDDAPPAARLGLPGPSVVPQHAPADEIAESSATPAAETPASSIERAGISIAGDGPLARAGAGFGAPSMPLDSAPFRMTSTEDSATGFDPILGPFATDRSGAAADSLLARLLNPRATPPAEASPRLATPSASHPAVALGLSGQAHVRAERCLAEAVYWEARSEPERGQMAVAQVVLNRAVSGFYPRDVCGVVYQNAHRYLACQFTFACEGRRSLAPTEAEPWSRASRIAKDMMAGQLWLPEVGHATHYHATYVRPWWARSMNRLQQIGVHVFYRPRNWGSGPQVQIVRAAPGES
ncbi:MAG: cell wall hydrolase [Proteobacteria bacterium]|nr:cell wall hydrolase [Pseudomonadota bacterium]